MKNRCNDCDHGKQHYHKVEFKTDYWEPTPQGGWVCYCGKSYAHYHYDHKLVLIPGKKTIPA